MDAMSIALAGMNSSAARFAQSAQDVVKATSPNSTTDPAAAVVGLTTNSLAFRADIAVFKTADRMMGQLLDTLA